jgi:hypothetical protein
VAIFTERNQIVPAVVRAVSIIVVNFQRKRYFLAQLALVVINEFNDLFSMLENFIVMIFAHKSLSW